MTRTSICILALLVAAFLSALAVRHARTRALFIVLVAVPPAYMALRTTRTWSGENVVQLAATMDEQRARSLAGRFRNEDMFTARAMERPVLGWSGWGRFRVWDEYGRSLTTPDGMWIIALGRQGLVGLASLTLALLLPTLTLMRRFRVRTWTSRTVAPAVALSMVTLVFALDCLMNAMIATAYPFIMGAKPASSYGNTSQSSVSCKK